MKIVDAQVHIWAASTPERPWLARAEPHRAPLGKQELLAEMGKAGVDGVVIVPPSWEGARCDGEPFRPFLHHGPLRSRRAGRARADRRLEEAEGHARDAVHLPYRDPAQALAARALAGARAGKGLAEAPRKKGWFAERQSRALRSLDNSY